MPFREIPIRNEAIEMLVKNQDDPVRIIEARGQTDPKRSTGSIKTPNLITSFDFGRSVLSGHTKHFLNAFH